MQPPYQQTHPPRPPQASPTEVVALANEIARRAKNQMWLGILIFLIGIGLTIWTYADAGPGERYGVFFGAIIVGIARFFTALSKRRGSMKAATGYYQQQHRA